MLQQEGQKALQYYTIDARVGDMNENNRLLKKAQERVKSAKIVFTTGAGAGLGILIDNRNLEIDFPEASQITEACAFILLVMGCNKGILVREQYVFVSWYSLDSILNPQSFSVQLRPMVRNTAKALLHDVSVLERLYTGPSAKGISKTMLNVSRCSRGTPASPFILSFASRSGIVSRNNSQSSPQKCFAKVG